MQKWVVICWALLALVGADECPDGGRCEDGQTCCKSPANGYGCCPLDQAECCGDHIHCCPAGTLCDAATSSCVNATVSVPWVKRVSADQPTIFKSFRMIKSYVGEDDDNICPDLSRCPAEFSCLKALTRFGCCPLAQGVPCSDGKHCCPEGHQCSNDCRSCIKKETMSTVLCNDGVSECPDETTCCETPEGKWACCPMPKAVCCDDKTHCCPEGTTCDTAQMKCISPTSKKVMPMWAKFPARIRADWENQKDGEKVTSKEADDTEKEKIPEATTANEVPPKVEEVTESSVTTAAAVNNVPCNDTAACEDGTTCCETKTGDWACCPLPEAVCCKDMIHCCPKGKTCNLAEGTCDDRTYSVPWLEKKPTKPRKNVQVEVKNVPCDDYSFCPDNSTCCKTKEGSWACCPLPEAVCCEDFIHCCPKAKKCNMAAQKCEDSLTSIPWLEKIASKPTLGVRMQNVTCDQTYACPDGTTCCKTKEGTWACCPMPDAVCCDDHEHCCPSGTTCDLATLTCQGGSSSSPMKQKIPALSSAETSTVETATDSQVTSTMETSEDGEMMLQEDEESVKVEGMIQCDDHQTRCPQHTTCCFMGSSKKWGCCPLPEAVCCKDGAHCCPQNYTCEEKRTSCVKGEVVIPWYTKIAATTSAELDTRSVECDGVNHCPEDTTCCRLFTGEFGCCPLKNAVCCSDKEHCCPQGYTCDIASMSCHKLIMLQLETVPLTPVYLPEPESIAPVNQRDVKCDDQHSCKDDETCCRTSATSWGCCPSPNAVCCSDMKHCCPTGYTCTEAGSCTQNTGLHWYNWHVFLANKKRALIV